jgi:hypothetical protein
MTDAAYTFLSSMRQGAARLIDQADTLAESMPGRSSMLVQLTLNNDANAQAGTKATLYGPGDAQGIDQRLVSGLQPLHLTPDFEPNYFPAIEFSSPELPWMLTPAKRNADEQLRPWICLVAIERGEGTLEFQPGWPLPRVKISDASKQLPDPSQSWAWAHVQVAGRLSTGPPVAELLASNPKSVVSRLLCPRRLEAGTAYHACVVPVFMSGRQAGLGEEVKASDLTYAWKKTDKNFSLPVYYSWELTTGPAGDFEALVKALEPRPLPEGVGTRDLDVSDPGGGLPKERANAPRVKLGLEGALRAPGAKPTAWPERKGPRFRKALRQLLDSPAARKATQALATLAPPLYGRWHAARETVPAKEPHWLRELNLDPRNRVAAAMGTFVVQDNQEDLMAAAWDQAGAIARANQALRRAQLARQAGISMHERHFAGLAPSRLVQLSGPVQRRVLNGKVTTLRATIEESCLPRAAVGPAFRRLLRPRGPVMRRIRRRPAAADEPHRGSLVERLASGSLSVSPRPAIPGGTVSVDAVSAALQQGRPRRRDEDLFGLRELPAIFTLRERLAERIEQPERGSRAADRGFMDLTEQAVIDAPQQEFQVVSETESTRPPEVEAGDDPDAAAFRGAASVHQAALIDTVSDPAPQRCTELSLGDTAQSLIAAIDPRVTVPARLKPRIRIPAGVWEEDDPLEPIMVAPEFPQPMYAPLRDLSQDWLLPGLEKVPQNTLTVLESNPRFIESYMVGLNHEMSAELLWREYPTDQRGTYFRQFWDLSAVVPQPADEAGREELKDIDPIHEWPGAKHLGDAKARGKSSKARLVLLTRGELLKRYPKAVIYAVEAVWSGKNRRPSTDKAKELYPIFRGTLDPDVTFLAFDLTEQAARGSTAPTAHPGWFFVFQQQLTEPRFGLDASSAHVSSKPSGWGDLAWGHLVSSQNDFTQMTHAPVSGSRPEAWSFPDAPGIKWGTKAQSAHIAQIALQRPVRVAIHADDMLPAP